ncbi:MAG: hypothetical protein HQK77_09850 [Desulfobacterales bacterium]|nr:hypothetical protein [Desulfobacterales bacterium]
MIYSGRIYTSFSDRISDMSEATIIITQDITDEIKILLMTFCILLAIFGSISFRTRKIQKDFLILQTEHADLMKLIQNLSSIVLESGKNISDRLEHLAPALNQSLQVAGNNLLQFEENNQYQLLLHEFIDDILLLVQVVKKEEDKLREYQEHLEDLVRQRTDELTIAKERAEAANHAKSAFLSSMNHELRSPLNAILGFAQMMARSSSLPIEHQKNASVINRSGEHLLILINQVLDLSKIEAGRSTLNETNFDLHCLLDDVADMFSLRANEKCLQLVIKYSKELPRYVRTDEVKLRQILINLLSNAIKFTKEGGVTVSVKSEKIEPDKDKNESRFHSSCFILHFEIEDSGPGILPDELELIFEPFVQSKIGREAQDGTGLGLPISRKFVQMLGGDITVLSNVGKGTTFTFKIECELGKSSDIHQTEMMPKYSSFRYLYEKETKLTDTNKSYQVKLNPVMLADLSDEVQQGFRQAVNNADMELAHTMIKQIRIQNATLADTLVELVDNYRFDILLALYQ